MPNLNNWIKLKRNKSLTIIFSITAVSVIISCVNLLKPSQVKPDIEDLLIENIAEEENSAKSENNEENSPKDNETNAANKTKRVQQNGPQSLEHSAGGKKYQEMYPDLYCIRPQKQVNPDKTIFLTFDDGPSDRTLEVLDILREKGIKATFFVTGNCPAKGKSIMKKIVDEGHTIGVHTYTHDFKRIYSSVNAFLDDFNKIYNLIYEATGVRPTIFRFPGGSKNGFNKGNYRELIQEMTRRGFDYFDWNLSAGDAVSRTPTPVSRCISNVLNASKTCAHGVVLMHDARPKVTTVEALPAIIDGLAKQGFSFDKLSNNINPAAYSLVKPYR